MKILFNILFFYTLCITMQIKAQNVLVPEDKILEQKFYNRDSSKYTIKLVKFDRMDKLKLYLYSAKTDSNSLPLLITDLKVFLEFASKKFDLKQLNKIECNIKYYKTPILENTKNGNQIKMSNKEIEKSTFLKDLSNVLVNLNLVIDRFSVQNNLTSDKTNYSRVFFGLEIKN